MVSVKKTASQDVANMSTVMRQTLPAFSPVSLPPIRVTLVNDLNALAARRLQWNELAERSQTSTIFQTYEWHISWWKTLRGNARPLILLAEAGDELVGIAPLMVSERRRFGQTRRVVQLIGLGASDFCDLLIDRARLDVLPQFAEWLMDYSQLWDVIHLHDVPNTSSTLDHLSQCFRQRGYRTDIRFLYEAPTRLLGDPVEDAQVIRKKSLRRHVNYFQRNGRLQFKNCHSVDEIIGYLDLFFEQHIERRALTDTPSQFLDKQQRSFYRELVYQLAPTGWLLFSVVLFNDEPIAFHFGFEYDDRLMWYKPTFNVRYAQHSPGEVLIKYLLEYAIEQGVAEFDFTIGEEPFKYRFANHCRSNYALRVFRRPVDYQVHRAWCETKAWVKKSPRLAQWGRTLLGMFQTSHRARA